MSSSLRFVFVNSSPAAASPSPSSDNPNPPPARTIPPDQPLPFCSISWANPSFSRPINFNQTQPTRDRYGNNVYAAHDTGPRLPPSAPTAPVATTSSSPLKTGRSPVEGVAPSSVWAAKLRAARARASAQISANFRTAYRPGRSPTGLMKEEVKPSRYTGDAQSDRKRREERKRRILEHAQKKRMQPEPVDKAAAAEEERERVTRLWKIYLAQWDVIMATPTNLPVDQQLTARHVPCPLFDTAAATLGVEGLTKVGIEAFLMHPAHSQGKSRKERIRAALLQWHPDKFEKWICKFRGSKRRIVREVVESVARHLTDIMRTI